MMSLHFILEQILLFMEHRQQNFMLDFRTVQYLNSGLLVNDTFQLVDNLM